MQISFFNLLACLLLCPLVAVPTSLQAQDGRPDSANSSADNVAEDEPGENELKFETVLDQLDNPTGIAIQPETGHVFVADSGHRRVIRVVDGKLEEVITGFPKDYYGKGPFYQIGPLSLLFLDSGRLLVGGGGRPDGEDQIAVYDISKVEDKPLKADQVSGKPFAIPSSGDVPGEGNFFGMTRVEDKIFVTSNGDDEKAWVAVATIASGELKSFERGMALKPKTKTTGPTGVTVSPDGYLAVIQMGTIDGGQDSLLTFCNPYTHEIVISFKTGSHDLTALAYGPNRGRLFATDFNWANTQQGALVKLVALGTKGCESRKILPLQKPTALAFAENGDLYVTLAGNTSEGQEKPDGKLIVIKGLDQQTEAN